MNSLAGGPSGRGSASDGVAEESAEEVEGPEESAEEPWTADGDEAEDSSIVAADV